MQSSSDSSIWRSLAVAFGDGLAFGVGVKLSQNAARRAAALPKPESGDLSDRLNHIEQTIQRIERPPAVASTVTDQRPAVTEQKPAVTEQKSAIDQKVLEAIVGALEARLRENAGQVERRMADLDAKFAIGMKALDERDHSAAAQFAQDLKALESQLVSLNREFGEAVAGIVAEQVASQVEARAAEAERTLEQRITAAVEASVLKRVTRVIDERNCEISSVIEERLADVELNVDQRVASIVTGQIEPVARQLREEIVQKDREIVELRQKLSDADTNLLDIVSGIGQVCRLAAERMGRPTAVTPTPVPSREDLSPIKSETVPEPSNETPLPGFAQPPSKPNRLWRVPMVSSLVVLASGGWLLMHYL